MDCAIRLPPERFTFIIVVQKYCTPIVGSFLQIQLVLVPTDSIGTACTSGKDSQSVTENHSELRRTVPVIHRDMPIPVRQLMHLKLVACIDYRFHCSWEIQCLLVYIRISGVGPLIYVEV